MVNWFPVVFTGAVLVIGTVVAIAWWRLAAKAAPYADEVDREGRTKRGGRGDTSDVVVVKSEGERNGEGRG